MSGLYTDLLRKKKSLFITNVVTGIDGSDQVIPCESLGGMPQDTAVTLTIDRVDQNGERTPLYMERVTGVVSGDNLINCLRGRDNTTPRAHTTGAVIEDIWDSSTLNDSVDWALVQHNQNGTHKGNLLNFIPKGEYDNGTPYLTNDIISYLGASYIASQNTTGNLPTDTDYWFLIAEKGDTGPLGTVDETSGLILQEIDTPANPDATLLKLYAKTDDKIYKLNSAGIEQEIGEESSFLYRQALINGNFDVWQRGTSFAAGGYTADRWNAGAVASCTISQQTTGAPAGSQYCYRVAYTGAGAYGGFLQALESGVCQKLAGKSITISAKFRKNANFTSDLVFEVQKNATPNTVSGGTWSVLGALTIANATLPTGTTSADWLTVTKTITVPSDGSAAGLKIEAIISTAQDNTALWEASQVQLCAGDVALPFMPKSYGEELIACQRYCQVLNSINNVNTVFGFGMPYTTTDYLMFMGLPVTMRIKPTLEAVSAANTFNERDGAHTATLTTTLAINQSSPFSVLFSCVTSGMTVGLAGFIHAAGTNAAFINLSAEL